MTGGPAPALAPSPGAVGRRAAPLAAAVSLGILVLFLYLPATTFPLFHLDDTIFTDDPAVRSGRVLEAIPEILSGPTGNFAYLPLVRLSFLLDAALFGGTPAAFHRTNVVIFSACAAILPLLLWRMTGCPWRSFLAAALVALHPLRVEPVAWISARKDLLSFLFLLLCLASHVRFVRTGRARWYAASSLLGLFAILSKPTAVVLPALLLLADAWPLGRLRGGEGLAGARDTARRILPLAAEKLPILLPSLLMAWHVSSFSSAAGAVREGIPLASRTGHALAAPFLYLGKTFWPVDLPFQYFRTPWERHEGAIVWALPATVAISAAALLLARKRPYLAFGWGWYMAALLPTAAVLPASIQWLSDRFTLVPHVGLSVAATWLAFDASPPTKVGRALLAASALATLLALGLLSVRQLAMWKESRALLEHGLPHNGDDERYLGDLVAELAAAGRFDRAREILGRILPRATDPSTDGVVQLRHLELLELGEGRPAAIAQAREYLARSSDFPLTRLRLADLLFLEGRYTEAAGEYRLALGNEAVRDYLSRTPAFSLTRLRLADILLQEGRYPEAEMAYRRILGRETLQVRDRAHAIEGLGLSLAAQGRDGEALPLFEEALRLDPGSSTVRRNLEHLLSGAGRHGVGGEAAGNEGRRSN